MKESNKILGMVFFIFLVVFAIFPFEGYANGTSSQPPNVTSSVITNRTVAYMGNSVPGFVSISIKTDKPSRGYIDVTGNNQSTRINLSTIEFKTEHNVNWVPWNESQRKPLPPGTYTLRLNLSDADLNSAQGYPLGTITVVEETNPKVLIEKVSVMPNTIKPIYAENKALSNIEYSLSRHAEVQLVIRREKVYYNSPKVRLAPGTHSIKWNGRDNQGAIVPDGEYEVLLHSTELNFNNPSSTANTQKFGSIVVKDGEYGLPEFRIDQIIKELRLDQNIISRKNEDAKITGNITVNENATISIHVLNAAGITVNRIMEYRQVSPGVHSFTWDGRDMIGEALNGTYYLKLMLSDSQGASRDRMYNNLPIKIIDGISIPIPEPSQRVKVIVPEAHMTVYLGNQGYKGKSGETFTILEDSSTQDPDKYSVLIAGEVRGYVRRHDVELIDLEKIPVKYGYVSKSDVKFEVNPAYLNSSTEKITTGTPLRLLRKEGEWYRVLSPSGKQLYVKVSDLSMEPISTPNNIHAVVQGDTLWRISQQYNITVEELVRVNNLDLNKHLVIGQKLQVSTNGSTTTPQEPNNIYVVKGGDTLWKIAQTHNTTVNDIVALNQLNPQEHLYIGQRLKLPVAATTPSKPDTTVYTVKAGDTLWRIAQAQNTTVNDIVALNKLNPTDHLYIGQKLNMPASPSNNTNQIVTYTVKAGDSLWKIAQIYNTTVDKIAVFNQISPNQSIYVGQQLKIEI